MSQNRSREPRKDVRISVRFVADAGWADAEIRNVSPGGLMAVSPCPPSQGSYVEIRREGYSIVGRVVWSSNNSFGLQAREKIDLAGLASPRPQSREAAQERRGPARGQRLVMVRPTPDEQAQTSAYQARALHFIAVCLVGGVAACLVAGQVSNLLGTPLLTLSRTLSAASTD